MQIYFYIHLIYDLFYRIRNRIRRQYQGLSVFRDNRKVSDSQETFYESAISSILKNPRRLRKFRRVYDYREILEHVSLPIAQQYFEKIKINYPEKWKDTVLLNLTNDSYGNPRRYKFQDVGWISPTTLRYISTCLEIDRLINLSNCQDVVEIGVGYGGQAAVISRMFNIQRYSMFDLPIALQLTSIYLEKIDARVPIAFPGNRSLSEEKYDLVISNFAFSELPKDLQIKYLDEVICNSKNGYMIMNSGLSNKTGRSIGKLSLEEIMVYLPHAQIIDEIPLTGPDNYVIYWRDYAEAISSASIMR